MFTRGMEFDLGEDVNSLRDMVHRWAQERVRPIAAQVDRDNVFPADLWREMGWGWAMWNFRGSFGILDSGRDDVDYEDFRGRLS